MRYIYLFLISLLLSCSNPEHTIRDDFMYCSQCIVVPTNTINKHDSTLTRVINQLEYIYLVSDCKSKNPEILSLSLNKSNSNQYYIDLCFSIKNNEIYASTEGKSIKVGNKRKCILTTSYDNMVSLTESSIKTPGGNPTYNALSDSSFNSDEFTFTIGNSFFERKIYLNSNGRKQSIGNNPIIDLNRNLFLISPNVIITDLKSTIFFYSLTLKEFEREMGPIENWSVQTFLENFPINYNLLNNSYEGNCIVNLSNKKALKSNLKHDAIQLQAGQPVIIGRFKGIGEVSRGTSYLFPININEKNLCFSFYGNEVSSTLKVPLEALDIEPNIEQEIFVVIDIRDFKNALKTRSNNIPYRVFYIKNRYTY